MDWDELEDAVQREAWADALSIALEGWRAARHPLLADVVDALGARAGETIELGNEPEAKARFWWPGTANRRYGAWLQRISALHDTADDPRIAHALVGEITRAPWVLPDEADVAAVIAPPIALIARIGDARTLPALRALVAKPVAKKRLIRDYIRAALPRAIAAIEARRAPAIDVRRAEALLARWGSPSPPATKAAKTEDEASLLALVIAALDDDAPRAVLADHWLERGDPRGHLVTLQLKPTAKNEKAARALVREHEEQWLGDLRHVTKKPRVYRRGFLAEIALQKPGAAGPELWAAAAKEPALATVERIETTSGNVTNYLAFVLSPHARSLRTIEVFTKAMLETLLAHDRPLPVRELSLRVVIDPKAAAAIARSPLFPSLERVTFALRYGGTTKLMDAAESFLKERPLAIGAVPLEWGGDSGEFAPYLASVLGRLARAPSVSLMFDELFHVTVTRGTNPNGVKVALLCRHLRFARELLPELRALCSIEEVSLRLPPWFDEVLVPQDPLLLTALDGLTVLADDAWTAFLANRAAAPA